ncbi:MAG: hypothetical protein M5U34_04810 [Chloroflexi bacterium]|nr:hypothetical protein [Chloroflexota bacterium]
MKTRLETLARHQDAFFNCYGPDQRVQKEAAAFIAQLSQRPLLTLDISKPLPAQSSLEETVHVLLRDALLIGAVPAVTGWDTCLVDDAPPPDLLTALIQQPGPVIVMSEKMWQPRGVPRRRHFYWLDFPLPLTTQRVQLLTHFFAGDFVHCTEHDG